VLPEPCATLATHPTGSQILVGTLGGKVVLFPAKEGPSRLLLERWDAPAVPNVAFDERGRWAVAAPVNLGGLKDPAGRVLRVWDLQSGQERVYSIAHLTDASWGGFDVVAFAPDGSLYAAGRGGLRRLVLPADPGGTVSSETAYAAGSARLDLSRDGRLLLVLASQGLGASALNRQFEELRVVDLAAHTSRRITTHGGRLSVGVLDAAGRVVVTGDIDGVVRAGPLTGEEPHLLLGHQGLVTAVAVSPDGRWIASASGDEINLWPMPDVTKPPLHTLPHAELMAKLDTLTNLRVVADPTSPTGWKLDVGPFPGWKEVPTW
jgi:WD40 repeat protein